MGRPFALTKVCRVCKEEKAYELMAHGRTSKYTGLKIASSVCKVCNNIRIRDARKTKKTLSRQEEALVIRDKKRERIWKKYGVDREKVNELTKQQLGKCLICKKKKPLVVDHCHDTGRFRGLICGACNTVLGFAEDNITILKSAVWYLDNHGPYKGF